MNKTRMSIKSESGIVMTNRESDTYWVRVTSSVRGLTWITKGLILLPD